MKTINYHKVSIIAVLCLLAESVSGQTLHDALRFSRDDLYGTARSLSMGNAMTAIGGDIGALAVNPAASGVYRYSEFVVTPGLDTYTGTSEYLGLSNKQSKTRFNLGSIGFVGNVKTGRRTGLVGINWGIVGNQTAGYVSRTSAYGRDATSSWLASKAHAATNYELDSRSMSYTSGAPWDINGAYQAWQIDNFPAGSAPDDYTWYLGNTENTDLNMPLGRLDQQYSRESWGYTYDITGNVSFNISDKFFFGFNLTTQSIFYTDREYYREQAVDKSEFETGFEYMNYWYNRTTKGVGFKLAAGLIYKPFAGLSIGASISTPTWKRLRDFYTQDIDGYSDLYSDKNQYSYSPDGDWSYRMTTPFQWNVGLGYTIKQRAVISVDYSNTNMSNVTFKQNQSGSDYSILNSSVKTLLKSYHTVRAGLEVRVVKGISLRGGYNYMSSPIDYYLFYGDDLDRYCSGGSRQSWSAGIGYRGKVFFVDVAFQQQLQNVSEYLLYDDYCDLWPTTYTDPVTHQKNVIYTRDGNPILAPTLRETFKPWKLLISFGFKF